MNHTYWCVFFSAAILPGILVVALRLSKRNGPPLFVVDVRGHSMDPLLRSGDRVLATGFMGRKAIRSGALAIIRSPESSEGLFIKEIVAVAGDPVPDLFRQNASLRHDLVVPPGCLLVLGKHAASKDSKQWGYLPETSIHGRVILRLGTGPLDETMRQ
ncbi:S26 family signal peptidase [Streptomyces monashensis]|uniref:S26 family signal peptidase n=1 Tax=Streptomyces monashensis TaxID=1678012 RepID=UPI0033E0CAD4